MAQQRIAVIGGGIVGLATARQLLLERPDAAVTVLEKETEVGCHQTSHNSGVVHAGLYYQPGSLKATLCTQGRTLLRQFCGQHHLPYLECGKLVIARNGKEVLALRAIEGRARANHVPELRWLDGRGITEIEPHAVGVAALHSPRTAIVDYAAIACALAGEVRAANGSVRLGTPVQSLSRSGETVVITTPAGTITADRVIICAGLQADRVAGLAGDGDDPVIVPFRGEYCRLLPAAAHLVRGLIYPVPDPRYPFLGVHFTRRVDGGVDLGPNAVLALSREGYRRRDVRLADVAGILAAPGFRRLARRHARAGIREMWTSVSRRAFLRSAREFVPALARGDVIAGPSGVRAQAVARDGSLVDDFVIHALGPVVAVRNAPSPAATSSLAIAQHLAAAALEPAR